MLVAGADIRTCSPSCRKASLPPGHHELVPRFCRPQTRILCFRRCSHVTRCHGSLAALAEALRPPRSDCCWLREELPPGTARAHAAIAFLSLHKCACTGSRAFSALGCPRDDVAMDGGAVRRSPWLSAWRSYLPCIHGRRRASSIAQANSALAPCANGVAKRYLTGLPEGVARKLCPYRSQLPAPRMYFFAHWAFLF